MPSASPPAAVASGMGRHYGRWLALYALLILGAGIGLRDPWPSDEPRFALAALHMVQSGDWIFPHRGSELYADKPPMLMWLQAAAYALTGRWRIAFLLPSLLAALGTLALVYDLGRRLWSRETGLYAAAAVLMSLQMVYQFKRAQIDPLETFFVTAANWGILRHLLQGPNWRAWWLGCACVGLGIISKGVGFIAWFMLLPYLAARRLGFAAGFAAVRGDGWRWLLGLLAAAAASLLWLGPLLAGIASHAGDPAYRAYLDDILLHQTADRYARSWGHLQPPWYFLIVILLNWLPLSLAYPGLIPCWRQALRARDPRIMLPLAWIALVLVFFSLPAGKRDVYVMPAMPMLALIAAPYLPELVERRWLRWAALSLLALLGSAALGLGLAMLGSKLKFIQSFSLVDQLDHGGRALGWMLLTLGLAQWTTILALGRQLPQAMLAGFGSAWLIWGLWASPLLNDTSSAAGLMREVRAHLGPQDQLGLIAWKEQNLLMLGRPAQDFGFLEPWPAQYRRGIAWQGQDPMHRWLFALDAAVGPCIDRRRAVALGHANRRDWWLFQQAAVIAGCQPGNPALNNHKQL